MVPRFLIFRGLQAKFFDVIEHQASQQCTNTKKMPSLLSLRPLQNRHIMLPVHSNHVKNFRAMGSASSFGWGERRQIEGTTENEHPSFPHLFCISFFGQEPKFCQRNVNVSPRTRSCCKECFCLRRMPWMQPVNGIQDQVSDFHCCSKTKCIRAICVTRLGQPQPGLVFRGS